MKNNLFFMSFCLKKENMSFMSFCLQKNRLFICRLFFCRDSNFES